MATTGQSGVDIDQLVAALSRLVSSDQRPPTAPEAKVIGHFTDLNDFLGRNGANVPFEFIEDDDDTVSVDATRLLTPKPTPAAPTGAQK
jgi:hypothetical protein